MSSSSSHHQWTPKVLVSCSDDDVEKTFIQRVLKRLEQAGIGYFRNNTVNTSLPEAKIREAWFALVVFSVNYAYSSRCLNELVEILNNKRDRNLVVIPVFRMDRAGILNLASGGDFKQALARVEATERDATKEKWRSALEEAQEISGYELKAAHGPKYDDELKKLVDKIVERLVNQIHSLHSNEDFVFGPFGGNGGISWNSGDIKGIDALYGDFIMSIEFKVDITDTDPQYGRNGDDYTFKVKLENGECITSVAGYFNIANRRINSLAFRTNKRMLGPIGRVEGNYFSVPSKGGKVVEIFGTKNDFLTSIGARVKLNSKKSCPVKSVGLFGRASGSYRDVRNDHTNVKKIIVERDSSGERFIRSIVFRYEDNKTGELGTRKTNEGIPVEKKVMKMDPDEYLTSISGSYEKDPDEYGSYEKVGITSLTFRTNKKGFLTTGAGRGTRFSPPTTDDKIVGLYGWSDGHLRGIGAYFEPGPYKGGNAWDEGKFDYVREIHVWIKDYVRCIMFVYDDGSEEGRTFIHGCNINEDSSEEEKVELDYPREYLTWISGYMQQKDGANIIQSLTFYSNKKTYGPYPSKETGEYFCYPSAGSRIIGFYGTGGNTLNSIGVHAEPIPYLYPFKTDSPFEGSGGTPWDDGAHTDVRGFRISYDDVIRSIQIIYDDNNSFVLGSERGTKISDKYKEVMLDFPKERLASIKFKKDENGNTGETAIHHLKIFTTKTGGTYGPFARKASNNGPRVPTEFTIPSKGNDGRIVGFFGRARSHLNSIGAHLVSEEE